ncbi:unnamed protein product, partial [Iphiclides podalirius]
MDGVLGGSGLLSDARGAKPNSAPQYLLRRIDLCPLPARDASAPPLLAANERFILYAVVASLRCRIRSPAQRVRDYVC